jgi:hypothetical protein
VIDLQFLRRPDQIALPRNLKEIDYVVPVIAQLSLRLGHSGLPMLRLRYCRG